MLNSKEHDKKYCNQNGCKNEPNVQQTLKLKSCCSLCENTIILKCTTVRRSIGKFLTLYPI